MARAEVNECRIEKGCHVASVLGTLHEQNTLKIGVWQCWGRARSVVFEAHCEVHRTNFSHSSKKSPKMFAPKTFFQGKFPKVVFASRTETRKYGKT